MSKKLRVLSLVLVLLFLLPLFPSKVSSAGILPGPIDTSEDAILKGTLEDAAEEYVTKFINTAYLYKVEDFSEGTLIEQQARNGSAMPAQISLVSGSYTTAELCENIQFFADLAGYYRYVRMANQVVRENFKLTISDFETTISGDTATVKMYTLVTFRYPHLEDDSAAGEYFTVSFAKINSEWCIVDIVSEEMEVFGMNKDTFDIQEEIAVFEEQKTEMELLTVSGQERSSNPDMEYWETLNPGTVTNKRSYNRGNAKAYAFTYTTSSYTANTGNNTSFINNTFPYYSTANCMNFASQCVWAGFYGSNTSTAVSDKAAPMDSVNWYSTQGTATQSWKGTLSFWNYAGTRLNATSNGIIFRTEENVTMSTLSNRCTALEMMGAVILTDNEPQDQEGRDHALVCTSDSNTQIIFCANSPMRKAYSNADAPYYFTRPFDIVIPQYYQTVSQCTGHTYETGTDPDGLSAKCRICGYLDLRITSVMKAPIPAGTTLSIAGVINRPCYRTAIGISYNGGTTSWTTYSNVSSVFSRSYTFSQTGLYTITLSVRDTNDATNTDSQNVTHVYTIRVY